MQQHSCRPLLECTSRARPGVTPTWKFLPYILRTSIQQDPHAPLLCHAHYQQPATWPRLVAAVGGYRPCPFLSVIRDPNVYDRNDHVVLTHTCRYVRDLAYREYITSVMPKSMAIRKLVRQKLIYYPTVTRELFAHSGRITTAIWTGKLFDNIRLPPFSTERDRIMLCGGSTMLNDLRSLLDAVGFQEGTQSKPGHYVAEWAFAS
jgi:ferredoxin-NADP reductase